MAKVAIVIASDGFQDTEYQVPKKILDEGGVNTVVVSSKKGKCMGSYGLETEAELEVSEVNTNDYDAIVFIGGPGAHTEFNNNPEYLRLSKEAKILAAICIAPTLVSQSGVLDGKRVTGWDDGTGTQIQIIESNGAEYTGEAVTVDGNVITANGPPAAEEFGKTLLNKLK